MVKAVKFKSTNGFTIIETVVAIFVFSIIAPSLLLVVSFIVNSSYYLSSYYLDELTFRSYLERQLIQEESIQTKKYEESIIKKNGLIVAKITIETTPHPKIVLQTIQSKEKKHSYKVSVYRFGK